MKIVTAALLAARCGEELREETAECTGTYPLLNGDVTCVTQRGIHDIESALGYSCNTFFAQKIIGILDADPKSTWENLERMGFSQEGQEVSLDRLHRTASSTGYDGDSSFSGTWSLIGQGTTQVSPIDMVRIVSALVNNGTAAEPYLVENAPHIVNSVRRKLLEEAHNLPAAPVEGAVPQESVDVPSIGTGSFQAVPQHGSVKDLLAAPASTSPHTKGTPPKKSNTNDNNTALSGIGKWAYILILPGIVLLLTITGSIFMCRRQGGRKKGPWKTGLTGQLQKALITGDFFLSVPFSKTTF